MHLPIIMLLFAAGVAVSAQAAVNARLAVHTNAMVSSAISFSIGTIFLLAVSGIKTPQAFHGVMRAEWWSLCGGIMGAFFVAALTYAVPKTGTALAMGVIITAQLFCGLVMDHFGLFHLQPISITPLRAAGAVVLSIGTVMMLWKS